jgi:Bax protein
MAETAPFIRTRFPFYALLTFTAIVLSLLSEFGFQPLQFLADDLVAKRQDGYEQTSGLRLKNLEKILFPAPKLSFVTPPTDFFVPDTTPGTDQESISIEPVYIKTMPDLSTLTAEQRKKQFITFMLPLILRANLELEERLQRIDATFQAGQSDKLKQWAELYNFNAKDLTDEETLAELHLRVRPVPVSIALVQSVIESGWGTSRFAIQGNAVYGQWAWSQDAGIKPEEARYENVVVRSFTNLFDSVRAYMHNLNTHPAYKKFRRTRKNTTGEPTKARISSLMKTLDQYSEQGNSYVDRLFTVMNGNNLWVYDQASLAPE